MTSQISVCYSSQTIGHLKFSYTRTAEIEIDEKARDCLILVNLQEFIFVCFLICCFTSYGHVGTVSYPNHTFPGKA